MRLIHRRLHRANQYRDTDSGSDDREEEVPAAVQDAAAVDESPLPIGRAAAVLRPRSKRP